MADEIHPLVTLLVERAKTHPEEFLPHTGIEDTPQLPLWDSNNRWQRVIDVIRDNGTEEEQRLIDRTIGRIRMDAAHEWALDELMNGPERRAAEQRRRDEEREKYERLKQAMAKQHLQGLSQGVAQGYAHTAMNVPPGGYFELGNTTETAPEPRDSIWTTLLGKAR
jgi:hypothetical protein